MPDFYITLTEIMDEKGMGIADVARACGLTDSTVRSIIDRQQKKVALSVAFKLSDGLGVSLARLNGEKEEDKKEPKTLSAAALRIAHDYESLDEHGRKVARA